MRPQLSASILVACWFLAPRADAQPPGAVVPDYSLDAFGGHLFGTNHGEWIGELMFRDSDDGSLVTVLSENVHGIVQNPDGVFVFTGLAHLSLNEGYIYAIARRPDGQVIASRLGRLPGAPSRVSQAKPNGATSFLVYSGYSNARRVFECYQLVGSVVSRGHDCLPPK